MRFVEQYGLTVRRGPFAGMRYPASAVGRANFLGAKLLGSYEEEIAPLVATLIARGYTKMVNIGAGEGYYAVGFALRSPGTQVYAFESTRYERSLCQELASENHVEITIDGYLPRERLAALPMDDETLLFADVEGGELELLQPALVPALRQTTLLVELHPHVDPSLPEIIAERFGRTHDQVLVESVTRRASDYSENPAEILLSEGRTEETLWGLWTPRP